MNYDRNAVVDYCSTYHQIPNPLYGYFVRGDCANFASQCIHAGGVPMNDSWYFRKSIIIDPMILLPPWGPMIFQMEATYYLLNGNAEYSSAWSVAFDNYEYFGGNDDISYGEVLEFDSKEEMQNAISNDNYNIQPGDLMYMQWGDSPSHATVIDKVNYSENTLKYSAHTMARNESDVIRTFWNASPEGKLYIVRLRDVIIIS